MHRHYTLEFPTLEKLCSFKHSIEPEAYIIDVSKKTISCFCSDPELKAAFEDYEGRLTTPLTVKFVGTPV